MIEVIAHVLLNVAMNAMSVMAVATDPATPPSVALMIDYTDHGVACVHHDVCVSINDRLSCTPAEPCEK